MATLYTEQESNNFKTWTLMSVLGLLIIGIGWFFSYYYQSSVILYFSVLFSIGINVFSYWYSDKIALAMSRAKEAKTEDYPDYHRSVENLAITAGLPKPRLYIIEDPAPNAFATGRNKDHSAVAVTTGLLATLDKNELEGVLAHELAHIGNKDILISTIAVVLAGALSIVADIFLRSNLSGNKREGGGPLVIIGIILVILAPIAGLIIRMAISRKREYLADATGALLTRYPEGLASALKKISSYGAPLQSAHDATAHMYISNPFGAKAVKGFHSLFMTHPPVEERIRRLNELSL